MNEFIEVIGLAIKSNGETRTLPFVTNSLSSIIGLETTSDGKIRINTYNDNRSDFNAYITLRYTKTS